ncbi:hypothetical protein Ae201684P_003877 [Aphanomyces euteiches]|nr:hypothetical protein Ae201684P_003877 [Aphanomyces euteiches]
MANQDRQGLLDTIHEMDIELRQAARAGLLLLEKNEDLEAQVDRLTALLKSNDESPPWRSKLFASNGRPPS